MAYLLKFTHHDARRDVIPTIPSDADIDDLDES
jgi:hypothetical protein